MPTADELRQKLDALKEAGRRAEQQLPDFDRMREQITQLEATATSPDRDITVKAGPSGSIMDIQFAPDALRQSPSKLSQAVMTTLREAVAEAARKQASIVEEAMPNSGTLDQVLRTQEEMFGNVRTEQSTTGRSSESDQAAACDDEGPDSFLDNRGY